MLGAPAVLRAQAPVRLTLGHGTAPGNPRSVAADRLAQRCGGSGGITGALLPGPRRRSSGAEKSATRPKSGQQTVYILGEDGKPQPVQISTGNTNGQVTEVVGGGLRPGMKVITGQLAAGQTAPADGGQSRGQRGTGGGGGQRGQ